MMKVLACCGPTDKKPKRTCITRHINSNSCSHPGSCFLNWLAVVVKIIPSDHHLVWKNAVIVQIVTPWKFFQTTSSCSAITRLVVILTRSCWFGAWVSIFTPQGKFLRLKQFLEILFEAWCICNAMRCCTVRSIGDSGVQIYNAFSQKASIAMVVSVQPCVFDAPLKYEETRRQTGLSSGRSKIVMHSS